MKYHENNNSKIKWNFCETYAFQNFITMTIDEEWVSRELRLETLYDLYNVSNKISIGIWNFL